MPQETLMKAMTYERYGGPEVIRLDHRKRPRPGRNEVRIRTLGSSINAADDRLMRADPFLVRLSRGLFAPRQTILGTDLAGIVEEVGSDVRRFEVGDAVFGHTELGGAFAEQVCVPEAALAPKPEDLDFESAASLVLAGFTALQAVRDRARIRPGQSVLIQGAGGGVGTLLVQIAKAYGARITAVCGPGSVDLVSRLGAERVLDYTARDFTDDFTDEDFTDDDFGREGSRYDVVFGVNGHHPLATYRDVLNPGGTYVMVGGENRQIFEALFFGALRFAGSGRRIELLTLDKSRHPEDLEELRSLVAAGQLRPVLDRSYPLAELAEGLRYMGRGHVRGKIAIRVDADEIHPPPSSTTR